MDYKKIVDDFVEKKLIPKKVLFYSCGILFSRYKKIKLKIEFVVKRPNRFNKNVLSKIPKTYMGLKVKVV